jgi:DNA-directed RNA polymerase subunit RPC12/RpoP
MMSISFKCEWCGRGYKSRDELAGKTVKCKECGQEIHIPAQKIQPPREEVYDLVDDPAFSAPKPVASSFAPGPYPAKQPGPARRTADKSGKATTSFWLGIVGMIAWILPIVGLPVSIAGLITGGLGLDSEKRGKAVVGIVLSIIALLLSIANGVIGAILASKGLHRLVH